MSLKNSESCRRHLLSDWLFQSQTYIKCMNSFFFLTADNDSGKYVTPARRQPQGNVGPNNRNSQPQPTNRQQQVSPMSRGGRRDYSGSSPAASGASAHSGRDQHYHDDFTRGGGGRGRGDGRGGNFNKDANRGPGGRPEKRMGKFCCTLRVFISK